MRDIMMGALRASLVTWVLCGLAYPLALTGLGQWLMPFQANGSLERKPDGAVIGSRLIGQQWNGPEWFHGRPSVTTSTDPTDPDQDRVRSLQCGKLRRLEPRPGREKPCRTSVCGSQRARGGAAGAGRRHASSGHADDVGLGSRSGYQPGQCGAPSRPRGACARCPAGGHQRAARAPDHRPQSRHLRRATRERSGFESRAATCLSETRLKHRACSCRVVPDRIEP